MSMIDYGAWKAFFDAIEEVIQPSPLGALCEEVLPLYRECLGWLNPRQTGTSSTPPTECTPAFLLANVRHSGPNSTEQPLQRGKLRITASDIQLAIQVWSVRRIGFNDAWLAIVAWSTLFELARGSKTRWYLDRIKSEPVGMSAFFEHLEESKTEWLLKYREDLEDSPPSIVLHGPGWQSEWYLPQHWWREPENTFHRRISENDEECLNRLEQFYREQRKELTARIRFQNGGKANEGDHARWTALRTRGVSFAEIARETNLDRKYVEKSVLRFARRLGLHWPVTKCPATVGVDTSMIDEEVARHYSSLGVQVSVDALRMYSAARRLGLWDFEKTAPELAFGASAGFGRSETVQ